MTYDPAWLIPPNQHVPDASGYPVVSTVTIDLVVAGVLPATWTSVGPTGSGATVIWTALDGIPLDANWLALSLKHRGTSGSAAILQTSKFYVRKGGTAIGIAHCQVSEVEELMNASGQGSAVQWTFPKVQLDSANVFDVYWLGDFTNHELDIYAQTYGY